MGSRRGSGARRSLLSALLAAVLAVTLVPAAEASHDVVFDPGVIPPELLANFSDCPELPPDVLGFLCLNVRVYDGDIKLGDVEAQIDDPIEISVAIGLGDGFEPVIAVAEPEPEPASDNLVEELLAPIFGRLEACGRGAQIPGGLLGLTELDPIISNDPVSLLCLSASPEIGAPEVEDAFGFLGYLLGNPVELTLGVPLAIRLNNLLLGEKCWIGTPESPIMINLTNGTTSPPEGVDPISGSTGDHVHIEYTGDPVLGQIPYVAVTGSRFVDNGFSVPGSQGCDILVGDLLDGDQGLFDPVVNQMAGLPSAAGNNHAMFSLDTEITAHFAVHNGVLTATPDSLDFGEVAVGESSEAQTVSVESTGTSAAVVQASLPSALQPSYQIDGEGCVGEVLEPGQSCDFDVRFTPNGAGARNGNLNVTAENGFGQPVALTGTGTGDAPLTATPLAFGTGFVGQPTAPQTMLFTNTSGSTVTAGPASLAGTASRFSSWEITDNGCDGATVAPGDSCGVDVVLHADSTGTKTVNLEVRRSDGAFLGSGQMTGSGAFPLVGPAVPFGSVQVGDSVGPQSVVFTNNSPNPVEITEPARLGGTSSRFTSWQIVDDGCDGQTVAPGASCQADVVFSPDSTGVKTVTLQLVSDELTVGNVSMSGSGVA